MGQMQFTFTSEQMTRISVREENEDNQRARTNLFNEGNERSYDLETKRQATLFKNSDVSLTSGEST